MRDPLEQAVERAARVRSVQSAYREGWNAALKACAVIALEQRCERGTPWDLACVAIAAKIRESETR